MNKFEKTIMSYFTELMALETTMPMSSDVLLLLKSENGKKFGEYIKKYCVIEEQIDESKYKYSVPESELTRYMKYVDKINELDITSKILPRMYIVTLICQYDAYIGELISNVLETQPKILNGSDRKINFELLSSFENIEQAKEYLIKKEVESVLRDSHDDHISWFEKKLNIELRKDLSLIGKFIELTERRNIYTHCNGLVNESYIANCKKHKCCVENVNIGDRLEVTPEYYYRSINTLVEIGIKLGHIIWRSIEKNNYDKIEKSINNISFQLIKRENYDLAINLIEFALNNFKNFNSSANKLLLTVNLGQCYYWKKNETKVKEILDAQDWSLCTSDFLIAKSVLEKKYELAIDLLKKDNSSLVDKDALIDWPIFKDLRETALFKEYFKTTYGKTIEEVYKDVSPDIIKASFTLTGIEEEPVKNGV